jgi:hypothetical protein
MTETMNKFLVGIQGDRISIMNPPRANIPKSEALLLAAWLVVLAEDHDGDFECILEAVRNS